MSYYNYEGQPEGDWDDRGDLSWGELDWQHFLKRQEKEVARFLQFYDQSPAAGLDRLDWVARQMGWDSEDWSVSDLPIEGEDDEEEDFQGEEWKQESSGPPSPPPDDDPYTLHRHPVFVVSTGLLMKIRYIWRGVMQQQQFQLNPLLTWDFSESLSETEKHTLLALQSMEMGDYLLCVVHLKRALRGVNIALSLVPALAPAAPIPEHFRRNMLARLFDLREVCLRVIGDCREEEHRGFRDSDL